MVIDTCSTVTMMNQASRNRLRRPGMWLKKPTVRLFTVEVSETKCYGNRSFAMKIGVIELWQQLENKALTLT